MKEITLEAFKKLPKRGPYSGSSLKPGTMYYIHDNRNSSNPVYIGTYVGPTNYYGDHATMVNYKFENVRYLVKPSNYRNEPGTIFGNVHKYYEVPLEPTSIDIKHKKTTIKELKSFINEKKAEQYDTTPPISFMGKDYRKVRDKFYNKSRSSSTKSTNRSKRSTPTITSSSSSSSRKRSKRSSSRRTSSSRTPSSSSPRSSYSSRTSSSFRRRTRRT